MFNSAEDLHLWCFITTMVMKHIIISNLNTWLFLSSWPVLFVSITGHLDEAHTTMVNGYITTCSYF